MIFSAFVALEDLVALAVLAAIVDLDVSVDLVAIVDLLASAVPRKLNSLAGKSYKYYTITRVDNLHNIRPMFGEICVSITGVSGVEMLGRQSWSRNIITYVLTSRKSGAMR